MNRINPDDVQDGMQVTREIMDLVESKDLSANQQIASISTALFYFVAVSTEPEDIEWFIENFVGSMRRSIERIQRSMKKEGDQT